MKIAVIGAGISGLSVAQMLRQRHEVIVFEEKTISGGLISCDRIADNLFHKVGGHVFNSTNNKVLEWFWSFFNQQEEFVQLERNAGILIENRTIGYPIENHLFELDEALLGEILFDLLAEKAIKRDPQNLYEYLLQTFGTTLFHLYFLPYNQKIWQTDLKNVSLEWLNGKLPMPNIHQIVLDNILRRKEQSMVHASFYYPRYNGSQFIADRLSENLKIEYGFRVSDVIYNKNESTSSIGNHTGFEHIIYCGDIRKLPKVWKHWMDQSGLDTQYLDSLQSNGTSNLFCETDNTELSWLYIPGSFTLAHRIIYTGNFSKTNNLGSARTTCVVEFSGQVSNDVMVEEIRKLPGNLSPLASNFQPVSYVIQDSRTRTEVAKAKQVLQRHGVSLLGRFAEWEYYNMDKAIEAAFVLSEFIDAQ